MMRDEKETGLSKSPKPNALAWLAVSALVIALDQVTKGIVRHALLPYMPHEVIPHVLNWTLAFNRGAAFSFLQDASGWQTWLFGILAVVVCIGLIVWLARTRRGDWRTALPVALIIGGALGNLIDRLCFRAACCGCFLISPDGVLDLVENTHGRLLLDV